MSVHALLAAQPALYDWRRALVEVGPLLAEEEKHCDLTGEFVGVNFAMLRDRGFYELAVPVELGGAGLTVTELSAMLRELAHYGSSTALAFAMHTHSVAIAAWRWRHQNAPTDGLLKRVASERIQLLSSGGSDWLVGSGSATKVPGGYRVQGKKIFASGAPSADLFSTGAVEDTQEGPSVLQFMLPMNAEGVSIVENWDTLGMRGTGSHEVALNDVFVPDAAIGARRKSGAWHPLFHLISLIAIPLVYSVYAGIAEAAREIAVGATKRRDTATLEAAGALETELNATRIALDSMIALAETAQPSAETTNRIFLHRALVCRSAIKTVDLALDLVGGAGYFRKLGLERLFRDVQAARFHPLQKAPQRLIAGRMAFGLPIDA